MYLMIMLTTILIAIGSVITYATWEERQTPVVLDGIMILSIVASAILLLVSGITPLGKPILDIKPDFSIAKTNSAVLVSFDVDTNDHIVITDAYTYNHTDDIAFFVKKTLTNAWGCDCGRPPEYRVAYHHTDK